MKSIVVVTGHTMKMIELEGNRYVRAEDIREILVSPSEQATIVEFYDQRAPMFHRHCRTRHEAEIEARRLAKEVSKGG